MASKTALNAKNLEALGAERLAQLLIEVSAGNAAAKRKLRLALAGAQGPREAAREIARRLTSIARARRVVSWKARKALVADLETQRRAIVEQIAPADAEEALALMWRFMALASPVFERCGDSSGAVIDIFHQACADLGEIAAKVRSQPKALARAVFDALQDNGHGQHDELIANMAPALGAEGLAALKSMVEEFGRAATPAPPKNQCRAAARGASGGACEHEMAEEERRLAVAMALRDIADAQGDADGFIAQYDPETRRAPKIAAGIARCLLAAGRAGEALAFLERAEIHEDRWIPREWQDARLEALEAVGRAEEAQAFRWDCFERDLSVEHLRAYLERLPDFDDVEAEERAMAHALTHPSLLAALEFFLSWPAADRAAELLIARHEEIDGDHYEYLVPAAEELSERRPLAATLALRAMIDFTLNKARSTRYRYAAAHLDACARLAGEIDDFGPFETHDAYVAGLKEEHGRKLAFWSLAAV